ncbi:uncharacterized protein K460DRAFT_386372 [Cucurbitaria berberidis CBS 394.84]|uniref:Aminoglycoside phosphotransferase domain-containing protein n=1 Tax=Cucurbitaria berberidis CBS 394.84 TaxID=1168544 RepID=A0A9P4L940_9PLEO|nr:uncharacterized protein K460DRAFT_386372 [Cucurbitaria berberidis CBS 394.84]KAF1845993.1 hypothetical protein K460DRAFT_386372 [Cucurbitaria berberidis CBS 394.84]
MTIEITSDADLPKCIPAKKAERPRPQGFFSRTVIVTLQNGEDVVVQFRLEPLDLEPFQVSRRVLGATVPHIKVIQDKELESEKIWAYWMTRIPGKTWLEGARGRVSQTRVTTVRSLGRILSKGYVDDNSGLVIDSKLHPHLELLLASEDPQIRRFHVVAKDLIGKLDQLKNLPLFVAHFDLNHVNIMVDEDCEVSGIKFYMPPEFEDAERGFWQEIWDGIPENVRSRANPEAVQIAVTLGTLLGAFQLEDGKIGPYNPVVVGALPKFLTHRIALIRGSGSPYSE